MHFIPLNIFFCYTRGRCLRPLSRALLLDPIRGPIYYRRVWIPLVGSCASRSMFHSPSKPKSWKPWLLRGHYPPQKPLFSLQWPNIYNSCGKGIRAGKIGGIDMTIANFYHKRKIERWEEYYIIIACILLKMNNGFSVKCWQKVRTKLCKWESPASPTRF